MIIPWLKEKDRKYIEKVYKVKSKKEIAEALNMSVSTISRELRRCPPDNYTAKKAQEDANLKHAKVGKGNKIAWQILLVKNQIKTCLTMQPAITPEEISKITGIEVVDVNCYFGQVKKEMMEDK